MGSPQVVHLTDDTFDETIKNARGPVLVDFWAAWCGPCKVIAPFLDQLAGEMSGQATIAKVNVDENGDLSARFGIRNIPTLLIFKDGRLVDQTIGALPKESLRTLIQRHLAPSGPPLPVD
jgi:thioredoxin 1